MNIKAEVLKLKSYAAKVDWKLLGFLVLFLNVKLGVKIAALALIYLLQFDFKFGFGFKNSRLPLFYLAVIAIAAFNWIIYSGYANANYNIVFITGIGFWVLCILAIHQVKLSVERNNIETIHNTVLLFFVLNAIVSVAVLLGIIMEIHTINPYRYQGNYQKYFIGTGDYIKGLTLDVSTTNAVLNAFGVIYFLVRKNALMVLVCMVIMLLTGSNTINMMLTGVLILLFNFNTTKDQKSLVAICLVFLAVFMFKVSPQNDDYIYKTYYKIRFHKKLDDRLFVVHTIPITDKPDSILSPEERKQKIAQLFLDSIKRAALPVVVVKQAIAIPAPVLVAEAKPFIPTPSIHTSPFQHRDVLTDQQKNLLAFIDTHKMSLVASVQPDIKSTTPGKLIAMGQTTSFFQHHVLKALTGDGIGNFSSKLAFKATGLGFAGGFPARYAYINTSFLTNHLDLYLNFFSRSAGYHSLINSPNSVYDQLLSEYGIIGLLTLLVFYAGYFIKHYKTLSYGIPLLLLMAGVFFIDYWFEQLSIIVFFELLMLLNIKETQSKTRVYANQ